MPSYGENMTRTVLLTLVLSLLMVPKTAHAEPEQNTFTIGFIGSFSGPAQIYGEAARNGLELARSQLAHPAFDVIYEDDAFEPKKTVAAFKKLVDIDHVDAIVTVGSTPSNAVAPLAELRKVPLLAWASDKRVSHGRQFVVRTYPSGHSEGEALAREAVRRGLKRIALITSLNDYAHSWRTGVADTLSAGGTIALDEETQPEVKDFRPLLLRAQQRKVDGYLVCLDPGQNGLFARQLSEFGIERNRLGGCEYLHDKKENEVASGALTGAWFVTIHIEDDFRKAYIERFGNDSVLSGAACYHDVALLVQKALTEGRETRSFIEQLRTVGAISGAVGTVQVSEAPDDRWMEMPLEVREVSETGSKLVAKA
ncbi:MAG: ABC transporter substrate-binding protein, partial [Bdellovibrionales bacterium]|nr:ABC transporter substrate-binding protein [Bdellovibrionales bacterium]